MRSHSKQEMQSLSTCGSKNNVQVRYEGMDGKGGEGEELDSSRKYEVRGWRGIAQTNIHKYSLKK